MPKPRTAAIVTIYEAPRMTRSGRRRIAAWLRKQAGFLEKDFKQLGPRYTARWLYQPMGGGMHEARGL